MARPKKMKAVKMLQVAQAIERHYDKFDMSGWAIYCGDGAEFPGDPFRQVDVLAFARKKLKADVHGCGTVLCWAGFGEALFGNRSTHEQFDADEATATRKRFNLPNDKLMTWYSWPPMLKMAYEKATRYSKDRAKIGTAATLYYIATEGFTQKFDRDKLPGLAGFVRPRLTLKQICRRAGIEASEFQD